VDSYPCPYCGGAVPMDTNVCSQCRRRIEPGVARLAKLQRQVAGLEARKRRLDEERVDLRREIAHASALRDAARREVSQRASAPPERTGGQRFSPRGRSSEPPAPPISLSKPGPAAGTTPSVPSLAMPAVGFVAPVHPAIPGRQRRRLGGPGAAFSPRRRRDAPPPRRPGGRERVMPLPDDALHARSGRLRVGAETSTGTAQTVLFALGGLLLAGAAIVLTYAFTNLNAAGRMGVLALITAVLLVLPVTFAQRRLVVTAETLAAVALLMVLLDGYVAWSLDLFGGEVIPTPIYFALVCLTTAGIAVGYAYATHLLAARYATLIVVQPVIPLLGYEWISGPTGWALALAGVAVLNLALSFGAVRDRVVFGVVVLPEERRGAALLYDAAWVLFAIAYGAAGAYATTALLRTDSPPDTIRAAGVLVLTAAIGVAGAVSLRREPLADISAGLATLALIGAAVRVAAVTEPRYTLLVAAGAVALAAGVVRLLGDRATRGPRLAAGLSGAISALVLVWQAMPAVGAPLRAANPYWRTDLGSYPDRVAAMAEGASWPLPTATLLLTIAAANLLPWAYRLDATVLGAALAALCAPAGLGLNWILTPTVAVAAAVVAGAAALYVGSSRRPADVPEPRPDPGDDMAVDPLRPARVTVDPLQPEPPEPQPRRSNRYDPSMRTAWICLSAALVLGLWASAASLTRPAATAITLAVIAVAGATLAYGPRTARTDPADEIVAGMASDAAAGGAVFALPGAVATFVSTLVYGQTDPRATRAVLVATFLAVAAVLTFAALVQVARRKSSPPIVAGATAAASVVALASLLVDQRNTIDIAVAILLLFSAILLWLAPTMDDRYVFGQRFEGSDMAAASVTVAGIAALARATSLMLPGGELFLVSVLVLSVAMAARSMPERWRRGPVAGAAAVGAVLAAVAGWGALGAGIGVIRATDPLWNAPVGAEWTAIASEYAVWGWQGPAALAVLACAAAIAVPKPYGDDTAAVLLGLAVVAAPVSLGLDWAAVLVSGLIAVLAFGCFAVLAGHPRTAYVRLTVGAALGLYTSAASLIATTATAGTLLGLLTVGTLVAIVGWLVDRARRGVDNYSRAHVPVVGGSAVAGALLAASGAAATLASLVVAAPEARVSAALTGACIGLVVAGLLCRQVPMYLPYVSTGVAGSATIAALASLLIDSPTAVYAATAAVLGVLAELLRVRTDSDEPSWAPTIGWRPDRAGGPQRNWRPVRRPTGFGFGVLAASGIPAAIAIALVAPAVAAALIGPYRWIEQVWTGTPDTSASYGWFDRWTAEPADVSAAAALTLAAALVGVGMGGGPTAMMRRAIATVLPGLAITLLIAPAALGLPWPLGNTATLAVAVMCGEFLALVAPPPDNEEARAARIGRQVIFVIGMAAAGTGLAGSLAMRGTTISTLGGTVFFGLIGALGGRTMFARLFAWQLVCGSLLALVIAIGLAVGYPARYTAFGVLVAATLLLALAAALPRLRRLDNAGRRITIPNEQMLIETGGYLGLMVAIAMTNGWPELTAAASMTAGTVLGVTAIRPGRSDSQRTGLIIAAAAVETIAVWLLLRADSVGVPEAYTLPFALTALVIGLVELRRRPELGSWLAYGPALVAAFAPTLVIVLVVDPSPVRRVLLILAAVLTVAVGAETRHKAPVTVGAVATGVAAMNEIVAVGQRVPLWVLLLLFVASGGLLVGLGSAYERRRKRQRLSGADVSYR
jgi:hypothetical protein